MSSDRTPPHTHLPAPCIVDAGIIVNKQDIRRLLCDLGAVRYRYVQDNQCIAQGEGYVVEVFSDPNEATLVANHSLYLNICSFDYLELSQVPLSPTHADPVSETKESNQKQSELATLSDLSKEKPLELTDSPHAERHGSSKHNNCQSSGSAPTLGACFCLVQENTRLQLVPLSNPLKARQNRTSSVALDAVVADMLSTNLDISDDDDHHFPF